MRQGRGSHHSFETWNVSPGQTQNIETQSRSCNWVTGINDLDHDLLTPRMHISTELELSMRTEAKHLSTDGLF